MLSNIRKRKLQEGFTIIEVMIVLAIAGLILLVVFLAVPALQRNARNTQRREDAGNLLSSVSEYVANNNGNTPTGVSAGTANAISIGASGSNVVPVNLGYFDGSIAGNVTLSVGGAAYAAATGANATTTDTIVIVTGAVCATNNATTSGASSRSVAIIYTIENNVKQCRAS
jgi:type IV pilus assembly protein PilA